MFEFDIQRFDEDAAENQVAENSAAETENAELPEGFEGLEEYKEEILSELGEKPQEEKPTSDYVPYQRFKEVIDEKNALKAQIEEMQKKSAQSQSPTPAVKQPPIPQPPPFNITSDFAKGVKQLSKELAMKWAKLTPEQVQQIEEYGEEGDDDVERWKTAKEYATRHIYSELEKRQNAAVQAAQNRNRDMREAIQSYNDFAQKEIQSPEYKDVLSYATGEFFDSLLPIQQKALASAYVKIETRDPTITPEEIMLVQSFFTNAKTAYGGRKARQPPRKNPAPNFPKTDRISGSNLNSAGKYTYQDLERIINETDDFDKLDPKIRRMFEF